MDRRTFVTGSAGGLAALISGGGLKPEGDPRLAARPGIPVTGVERATRLPLGLAAGRDGILYVPESYRPSAPAPLLVLLHGATGVSSNWFGQWGARAEAQGLVVLAPDSRGYTWDGIRGGFGADVAFIDRALAHTFARVAVDRRRVAVGGFSDGASYAISLGLANGDLFSRIVAFSPGFVIGTPHRGRPSVFVSHGQEDRILPFGATSGRIVPALRREGFDVRFEAFDGGHEVPASISELALQWLASGWPG